MSIQQNINQTLSLASLLLSQSRKASAVKEAEGFQGRQEQAIRGLGDIETNLKRAMDPKDEKAYNVEELKNIEERTSQYQKDIYDAKSAALNPEYKNLIDPYAIKQADLSNQLTRIREMSGRAKNALTAKTQEAEASKNFKNMILEGVVSPLNDPRKGGI